MDIIRRHQFVGNRFLFFLLCITVIGIPIALVYLIEGFVMVEQEIPDAQAFLNGYVEKK